MNGCADGLTDDRRPWEPGPPTRYGREGKDFIIVASKGGAPDNPRWFANIKASPEVECEVARDKGTETFRARARVVVGPKRDQLFKEMIKIWPSYADYQRRTTRLIPVIVLERQT